MILVGPGTRCPYCSEDYGQHTLDCPETEKKNRPKRFRIRTVFGLYRYGCYFPLTKLTVGDMGGVATGKPEDVEWIDPF